MELRSTTVKLKSTTVELKFTGVESESTGVESESTGVESESTGVDASTAATRGNAVTGRMETAPLIHGIVAKIRAGAGGVGRLPAVTPEVVGSSPVGARQPGVSPADLLRVLT